MRRGFYWSLASALLWSTTFVVVRALMLRHAVDPLTLSVLRFSLASLILFAAGMVHDRDRLLGVSYSDRLRLGGLAFFGITGMGLFLFYGQARTDAGTGSLIMSSCPVLILLLGPAVGERITLPRLAGVGASLAGCLLVMGILGSGPAGSPSASANSSGTEIHAPAREAVHSPAQEAQTGEAPDDLLVTGGAAGHDLWGNMLILASACCWAVYGVFSRRIVRRVGGLPATTWAMLFGAVQLCILWCLLPETPKYPSGAGVWTAVIYLAAFPTALAFLAWYAAMETISLSLLNVMQYLTPLGTLLLAWLFLDEGMTFAKLIGGGLILAGVAWTQYHDIRPAQSSLKMEETGSNNI